LPRLTIDALQTQHVGPVTLALEAGESLAISGPSGAGKSLLLRAVVDLDPHTGAVALDGRECQSYPAPEWRKRIGLLAAESQWWLERIGDHMPEVSGERLAQLGLPEDALTWQVTRCSTGERQRLALLRLLTNQPQVLLLDEPTASLDATSIAQVEALIERYRRERGAAVLWVSHDPQQIERVSTRQLRLEAGRLAA